ncbi:hypothetical protein DFP72DRAFT_1166114 [Ephemerocybe angulata]|uniref:F-box domain-containing protein n=1 Tax=Ephemerocybe angulata TaxID=980116 RepID=A0A8H6I9R2_9AGAR|nr:hypothetical protein DFP72DRAFT_1166114 [Tulosesus angulatus]
MRLDLTFIIPAFMRCGFAITRQALRTPALPAKKPMSLTDLPPEIISQILSYANSGELCRLATTCRTLNILALGTCFRRNNLTTAACGTVYISEDAQGRTSYSKKGSLLHALSMATVLGLEAFPILAHLNHLSWSAPTSQTDGIQKSNRWIKEAKQVKRFIGFLANRPASGPLEQITLDFSAAINFGRRKEEARMVNSRAIAPWLRVIRGLLDEAAKASKRVQIVQGGRIQESGTLVEDPWGRQGLSEGVFPKAWVGTRKKTSMGDGLAAKDGVTMRLIRGRLPFRLGRRGTNVCLQRLDVQDPSFLHNPTVVRWLVRWTRKASCSLEVAPNDL